MAEEPKAGDSTSVAAEKKPSKKLLIIGLVLGLALGGGGAAAVFLTKGDAPAEGKDGEHVGNDADGDPEAVETPVVETAFVKLDRLSAPFVYQGRILGYVLLDLSLEVEKGPQEMRIAQQLPSLRAAFLIEVTERPIGKPDQPTVIDYEGASQRLLDVANRELKGAELRRILITQSTRL